MRLSHKNLLPVLAIVAGGVIGPSLSFSFLRSRPSDVPPAVISGMVTGRVTNAQGGGSVQAAQVFIGSLELGALSRRTGRYLLRDVPAGTYTMTVARIGYVTTERQITVGSGQTADQDFVIVEGPLQVNRVRRQREEGRFVKAMEERESVIPTESFGPVEVRAIRQR